MPKLYDARDQSRGDQAYFARQIDEDYDVECDVPPRYWLAHHSMTRHLPSAAAHLLNCWYRTGCPHPEAFDEAIAWLAERTHLNASQLETEGEAFLAELYRKYGDPKAPKDVSI